MKKIISIIAVVLLAGAMAPCVYGSMQSTTKANSNPQVIKMQKVAIENFSFNPQQLTISVGTTVTWKNNDDVPHNVVFENFSSKELAKDETFSHTFDTKGSYSYSCGIHPSMTGQIIVK